MENLAKGMKVFDLATPTRHSSRKAGLLRDGVEALIREHGEDPTLARYLDPARADEIAHCDPGRGPVKFLAIRRSPSTCDRIEAAMERHGRKPLLDLLLSDVASGRLPAPVAALLSEDALDFVASIKRADSYGVFQGPPGDVVVAIGTAGRKKWAAQYPLAGKQPALRPGAPKPGAAGG
jgi:hypothetical protein